MGIKLLKSWFRKKFCKNYILLHKPTSYGYLHVTVPEIEGFSSLKKLEAWRDKHLSRIEQKNYFVYKRIYEESEKK